jgi:nitric oxide dioxygenase
MQEQWKGLVAAGVAPSRIHREVFGPDLLEHIL